MQQILVGNDLSARSNMAVSRASSLAMQEDARVEVLTVIEEFFFQETTAQKQAVAADAAERLLAEMNSADRPRFSANVVIGVDYSEILKRADALHADLIVLGTHRHPMPEMFRGTTAERVVRYGNRPVLVVKRPPSAAYAKTLIASDLSEHSAKATRVAASLTPKGEMTILHAVQRPFTGMLSEADQDAMVAQDKARAEAALAPLIEGIKRDLGEAAPTITLEMPEGNARDLIDRWVTEWSPDLLAMGTHGRTGISHALIGSTAEAFLSSSPTDVLVAKEA